MFFHWNQKSKNLTPCELVYQKMLEAEIAFSLYLNSWATPNYATIESSKIDEPINSLKFR